MLQAIVFCTLGQLATGILLFIAFVPPSKIGQGFGRFHTVLSLVLWSLALRANFTFDLPILALFLFMTFFYSGKGSLFYYSFLLVSLLVSFWMLVTPDVPRLGLAGSILIHLPPVLVLGSCSVAMLLGHWYLLAPQLSIRYLKILTLGLIASILIRSGLLVHTILSNQMRLGEIRFYDIHGFFLLQRVVLGLLITLILSVMTYFCVRIRATQSATGILYVVLVFCLVGEVIGNYLFLISDFRF